MRLRHLDSETAEVFGTHSDDPELAACIGTAEDNAATIRIGFAAPDRGNVMIVGRSRAAALGICTAMLFDLASRIISTPGRRSIYTTPPFSVLDFSGTDESRVFTDAALSLPLAVKLERATDIAMNTLTDLQSELQHRRREPDTPRHAKFLFLCALQAAHGLRSRGSYASAAGPAHTAKFDQILSAGTDYSVFSVVWCNSFANIELTMPDGLANFGHVIVLDNAGPWPDALSDFGVLDGDRSWHLNRNRREARPIVPFSVPTGVWCDTIVRSFS